MSWLKKVKVSGGFEAEFWRIAHASYNADDPQNISIQIISRCYKSEADFLAGESHVQERITNTVIAISEKVVDDFGILLEARGKADVGEDAAASPDAVVP